MSVRTLIVDDTITYRKILGDAVKSFPELEVVGTAPSGKIALDKMKFSKIDLVLLDIHMPDMDGVETLRHIKKDFPNTMVIMVSGVTTRGAKDTITALELGAVDFIPKPSGSDFTRSMNQLITALKPVIRLVETRFRTRNIQNKTPQQKTTFTRPVAQQPKPVVPTKPSGIVPSSFSVLAIGVSTGGPEALGKLIPLIPASISVPIVAVQHMPPTFTKSLADSLNRKSAITVKEAEEGEILKPGTMYIAQGGKHMTVRENSGNCVVAFNDGPPENSCRPAVDVLFRSVAACYGNKGVLSVILTGMGNDGTAGVRALKRKSCYSISQSEDTCVVYGMPRSLDEAGLTDISLPLTDIATEIKKRIRC